MRVALLLHGQRSFAGLGRNDGEGLPCVCHFCFELFESEKVVRRNFKGIRHGWVSTWHALTES